MPYSCWLPVCLNEQKERKIKNTAMKNTPYDEKASCWKSFMIWRLNDRQLYFVHPSYTMSAWNQGSAPDALTTCIPAAGACIVHTSYQLAQFKYFAVLLNFSSTFSPDPFQMCEPQAKWGGSKLHSYVLITHRPSYVWALSTVHA